MERIKVMRRIRQTNRISGQGGYTEDMPWYKTAAYIIGLLAMLFFGMSADSLVDLVMKALGW